MMDEASEKPVNLYKLLKVNPQAERSIIRHAYRYLVNIHHPSNELNGDPDMFKKLTDAWQLLSDDGRRAAYDATLDENERYEAFTYPKGADHINWPEQELRLATLQVLYAARKKDEDGGLSGVAIEECLQLSSVNDIEPTLFWLLDKAFIELGGESKLLITDAGIQYLIAELPKPAKPDEQ